MQIAPQAGPKRRRRKRIWMFVAAAVLVGASAGWYCVQRYVLFNFHTVIEGQLYRSGRPRGDTLSEWVRRYGIKTVLDLSDGPDTSYYAFERATVQKAGAIPVNHKIRAQAPPSAADLRRLIEILETTPRPVLVHCEAGAQRSGLASVLGAMAIGGQDYRTARKQMSMEYLLFYMSRDGVEGVLLFYEDYCRGKGIDTAGWQQFREWAMNVYQPPGEPAQTGTTGTVPRRGGGGLSPFSGKEGTVPRQTAPRYSPLFASPLLPGRAAQVLTESSITAAMGPKRRIGSQAASVGGRSTSRQIWMNAK